MTSLGDTAPGATPPSPNKKIKIKIEFASEHKHLDLGLRVQFVFEWQKYCGSPTLTVFMLLPTYFETPLIVDYNGGHDGGHLNIWRELMTCL